MHFKVDYSKRIYGLDLLRAIAIILVIQLHAGFFLKGVFFTYFPLIKSPDGVEIFFVLSGFLIGKILIKVFEDAHFRPSIPSLLTFWKRRWFRTLPNYFLILLINLLLVKFALIDIDLKSFSFRYLVFLQNFAWPIPAFFRESWSLAVEEWFYLLFPIFSILFLFLIRSKQGILMAMGTLIIIPLSYRYSLSHQEIDLNGWNYMFRTAVLSRFDTLIFGVLAAYIHLYYLNFWNKFKNYFFIIGLTLYIALMLLPLDANTLFTKTIYFDVNAISLSLMLPFINSIQNFKTILGKIITHISMISYSMYMLNLSISLIIVHNYQYFEKISELYLYLFYWISTIALSTLLYFFFEKPMMELREKKGKLRLIRSK